MSSKGNFRSRRAIHDLPPIATDDELLAWSEELTAPAPSPRRRVEPVRGVAAPPAPANDTPGGPQLSDEELFAEIYERALAASART